MKERFKQGERERERKWIKREREREWRREGKNENE